MTDIDPATRRAARALGERLASAARDDSPRRASFTDVGTIEEVMADGTALVSYRGGTIGPLPMTTDCVCAARGRSCVIAIDGPIVRVIGIIARSSTDFELPATTITGTLPVSHGGTGATTAAGARSSLGLQGLGAIDQYLLSRTSGSAGWVKLGAWNGSSDSAVLILDLYWGAGYNGGAHQNCHTRIFMKNGWQSTQSATTAFDVTVYDDGTSDGTSKVEVYVGAYSHNGCNVFVYTPWSYADGFYTVQLSGGSWQHVSQNVSGTSNVKQDVQYCRGSFKAGSGLKVADDGTLSVDNGAYVKLYSEGKDGYCAYRRCGCLVSVVCDFVSTTAKTSKHLGTLPVGCRPAMSVLGMAYPRGMNSSGQLTVTADGTVSLYTFEGSSGYVGGSVTFPLP